MMHYPEQLLWVPMQKPADIKNVQTMQKIRSHAQREVRRRERESKPKRLTGNSQTSRALHPDVVSGDTHSQVTPDEGLTKESEELTTLPKVIDIASHNALTIALGSSDPLAEAIFCQPQLLHQMIYRSIHAWNSEQARRVCGGGPHGRWQSWIPTLITNDTMLYAQAFSAFIHYQVWTRHFDAAETLALKDQAVIRINRSLSDPTTVVSDATLASVLCLAFSTHVENLGKDNYIMHMEGLKKMIELKGGWAAVCSNPVLGDTLALCDYVGAIVNRSALLYVPTSVQLTQKPSRKSPLVAQTSPLLSSIESIQTSLALNVPPDTSKVIDDMRELTRIFTAYEGIASLHKSGLTTSLASSYPRLCPPDSASLTGTVEEKMFLALYTTATLYTHALAHDVAFGHSENRKPLQLLQKLLESTMLVGWKNLPGALLWVILVGTAAERDLKEGNVIAGYLSTTSVYMGLRHWDAVNEIFVRFLAIERKIDERVGNMTVGQDGNM